MKSLWKLLFAFIVILLLCGVIVLFLQNKTPSPAQLARGTQQFPSARPAHPAHLASSRTAAPLTVPLYWEAEEAAYMLDVKVGANWVPMVFDTGSSHMSAKGSDCVWSRCDTCPTRACPCGAPDCDKHVFKPSSGAGSEGTSNGTSVMRYGSQETEVTPHSEAFHLYQLSLPCQTMQQLRFRHTTDVLRQVGGGGVQLSSFGPTQVYRIHRITGNSSSNIFGMSQTNGHGGDNVLMSLMAGSGHNVWSFFGDGQQGWFTLGASPCFPQPTYVPLKSPAALSNFTSKFYILPCKGVFVHGARVPKSPKYLLVDTGTTDTYASVEFGKALQGAGYRDGHTGVRLELPGVSLTYTAAQLRDPAGITPTVLHASPGRTVDSLGSKFAGKRVMLVGVHMMHRIYWEFDLRNQRVGIVDTRK